MLRALALLAVATTWSAPARAQPPEAPAFASDSPQDLNRARDAYIAEHGDRLVEAIEVEGLHRTHRVVIDQFVRIRTGDPLSSCDLGELYERLYRLAIFSRVAIDLAPTGEGVAVRIHVDEKWTLYPVPLLWLFQGTEVVGLVLAEA